jgi:hypothetical protein
MENLDQITRAVYPVAQVRQEEPETLTQVIWD